MPDLRECGDGRAADSLGRRIGDYDGGIARPRAARSSHQEPVVLGVRNLGIVEDVIAVVVALDLGAQPGDALLHACRRRPSSASPQAPVAMLEVDQLLAQVQDALCRQRASLLVLKLALHPVREFAADRQARGQTSRAHRAARARSRTAKRRRTPARPCARGRMTRVPSCWRRTTATCRPRVRGERSNKGRSEGLPPRKPRAMKCPAQLPPAATSRSATTRCFDASAVRRSMGSAGGNSGGSSSRLGRDLVAFERLRADPGRPVMVVLHAQRRLQTTASSFAATSASRRRRPDSGSSVNSGSARAASVDADEIGYVDLEILRDLDQRRAPRQRASARSSARTLARVHRCRRPALHSRRRRPSTKRFPIAGPAESAAAARAPCEFSHHHRPRISATPAPSRIQRSSATASFPA